MGLKKQPDLYTSIGHKFYHGQIPFTVERIRKDVPNPRKYVRTFAGGNYVFEQRLSLLRSKNKIRINNSGGCLNLADAVLTFEDLFKYQPNSPFLIGVRGIVYTNDGEHIAIDAKTLSKGVKNMKPFPIRRREVVTYKINDNEQLQEKISNVVLFPYTVSASLTTAQYRAVDAPEWKRKDVRYNKHMEQEEIVKVDIVNGDKVIHQIWGRYNPEIVVPLVKAVFEWSKLIHGHSTNMGFFLPTEPKTPEMQALSVGSFRYQFSLSATETLSSEFNRNIGVLEKITKGPSKNLEERVK